MDFVYQFNLGLIAPLFTGSYHEMFEKKIKKKLNFQKLAGLWLVGQVDNHVAIYGSKVAEGFFGVPMSVLFYMTQWKVSFLLSQNLEVIRRNSALLPPS